MGLRGHCFCASIIVVSGSWQIITHCQLVHAQHALEEVQTQSEVPGELRVILLRLLQRDQEKMRIKLRGETMDVHATFCHDFQRDPTWKCPEDTIEEENHIGQGRLCGLPDASGLESQPRAC